MSGDAATVRLTLHPGDALVTLERTLALAKDLEAAGFVVTLTGDLFVDARAKPPELVIMPADMTAEQAERWRAAWEREHKP